MFEAYAAAGEGAREVLALQQVIPLLAQVAGAGRTARDREGHGAAAGRRQRRRASRKAAIGASEQIKAATGVDLAAMAPKATQPPKPPAGR